jgi:hypothetical protein
MTTWTTAVYGKPKTWPKLGDIIRYDISHDEYQEEGIGRVAQMIDDDEYTLELDGAEAWFESGDNWAPATVEEYMEHLRMLRLYHENVISNIDALIKNLEEEKKE